LHGLLAQHEAAGCRATVTAVHSEPRFGALTLEGPAVTAFREKPERLGGRINGGFFVMEPEVLDLISDDSVVLESAPLVTLADRGELGAYLHDGFWKPMDTLRDRDELQAIWDSGRAPWLS
jgi:glucose-1-phosphate cytidylyltransferase